MVQGRVYRLGATFADCQVKCKVRYEYKYSVECNNVGRACAWRTCSLAVLLAVLVPDAGSKRWDLIRDEVVVESRR